MAKKVVKQEEVAAPVASSRPKLLYPALIVAAVSVTLLSLTGVAAMTGMLPGAHAEQEEAKAAAARCTNCGVVESVKLVTLRGEATGLGAVAGGVAGALLGNQVGKGNGRTAMTIVGGAGGAYAGNEIEKNTRSSTAYQIRVQMNGGETRTITQRDVPDVRAGDRVRISNGVVTRMY